MKSKKCCPKFNPKPWQNKLFNWKNKKFIKASVFTLFYMPINFGSVISKLIKKVETAKAKTPDGLTLSEHTSMWNMDLYLAVNKKIPEAENLTLSGKYFSRVYEGPFKETKKWSQDFEYQTKKKNLKIIKKYFWYTTCPKCAKKYGKNYIVIIAKVK